MRFAADTTQAFSILPVMRCSADFTCITVITANHLLVTHYYLVVPY